MARKVDSRSITLAHVRVHISFKLIVIVINLLTGTRFIWSASGAFLGVYAIVQDISIPASVVVVITRAC